MELPRWQYSGLNFKDKCKVTNNFMYKSTWKLDKMNLSLKWEIIRDKDSLLRPKSFEADLDRLEQKQG